MEHKYDVALSFAGENREYVKKVAELLAKHDVKVFYDEFEEVDLWGKDMGIHFNYVYEKSAQYCIIFISKYYKEKIWPNYEIRNAISKAIDTNVEYILPARFDDTEIDGLRKTLNYIDLRLKTPEQFSNLILKKLEKEPAISVVEKEQTSKGKLHLGLKAMIYDNGFGNAKMQSMLAVNITNIEKDYRYFNEPYFKLSHNFSESNADGFFMTDKLEKVNFPVKLEYGQPCAVNYILTKQSMVLWNKFPIEATVHAIVTTTVGEKFKSNEILVADLVKTLAK